ncbi:MAG: hypothetical protein FWC20_11460 [Oscillospiraceae bacterium]|nr:hypothetical protein [Oscillospiraceae bacterium]MCL2280004.1 hypothetical protein [Oscillospiraceae bacterium]
MKKFFQKICLKKNAPIALPRLLGLSLIISATLLLPTMVGCSENNDDNEQVSVEISYSSGNDNEYTPDDTESFNLNNDEHNDEYSSEHNDEHNDSENLGAAHRNDDGGEDYIIELQDPDFAMRLTEIQMRREYFLGRTIRFEGLFLSSSWGSETIYFVARLEGGCCGFHGFEVYLNDFPELEDETWVEVTGILEEFYADDTGQTFLRLKVIDLVER